MVPVVSRRYTKQGLVWPSLGTVSSNSKDGGMHTQTAVAACDHHARQLSLNHHQVTMFSTQHQNRSCLENWGIPPYARHSLFLRGQKH